MVVALETKNEERFLFTDFVYPPISDPLHDAWK